METPYFGRRRMTEHLVREGYAVNRKRVQRLTRTMGLEGLFPARKTTVPAPGHKVYPYLLRGVTATYPNHIWGVDITYIKTRDGFVYLVAFIDWYSRYVVAWSLSDTLQNGFVLHALNDALCFIADCGLPLPDICNSDQGSHFTSAAYTSLLEQAGIAISMDGRGRALDNIFVERLWRTVKYEMV